MFKNRKNTHLFDLRRNIHGNSYLQNSWNKYGEDDFVFEIIEIIDNHDELAEREQFYIDSLNTCNRKIGYNIRNKTTRRYLTEDGRRRLSEATRKARLGKSYIDLYGEERAKEIINKLRAHSIGTKHPHSEVTKKKLSEIQTGKSYVDKLGSEERAREVIEKIRAKNTGKKRTQEFKDSLSGKNNPFYGKTHTIEVRKRISKSGIGRVPPNKDSRTYLKYDMTGNLIEELSSSSIPLLWKGNVANCASGKKKSAYGFVWKYKQ